MRTTFKVEAEIDVGGEVVFDPLPREIGGRRYMTRSENEINAAQRYKEDERGPDPQTTVAFHCRLFVVGCSLLFVEQRTTN
jgi:hypothetical protein